MGDEFPYANHHLHQCVQNCAKGYAPNLTTSDCEECSGLTPYAEWKDRSALKCVATCPAGQAPDSENNSTACAVAPSSSPTASPSDAPTVAPSSSPTASPSDAPTAAPTGCMDVEALAKCKELGNSKGCTTYAQGWQ